MHFDTCIDYCNFVLMAVLACILMLFACIELTLSFESSCPTPALWRSIAKNTCGDVNHYHCLFDVDKKKYKQVCFSPLKNPAGSQVILDTNLNAEKCSSITFQPQPYFSNELNRCIYEKSVCNERGQTAFSDGTHTTERSCRCDHQKGFAFVFKTENQCFCVPSKEDCSCYLKPCLNSSYILSSGYDCVLSNTDRNICSFRESGKPTSKTPMANPRMVISYNSKKYNVSRKKVDRWYLLLLLALIIAVIAALPGAYFIYKCGRAASKNSRPSQIEAATLLEIQRLTDGDMFVTTDGYLYAAQVLNESNVVFIKGRYGTGKTNTALKLASDIHDTYTPYIFDKTDVPTLHTILHRRGREKKILVILENIIGDSLVSNPDLKEWKRILSLLLQYKKPATKIIITTYVVNHALLELLLQYIDFSMSDPNETYDIQLERFVVDLDELVTISNKEKEEILERHCRLYGKEFPSDYQDIVSCDSFLGYPLMCALFCSDNNNFAIGAPFFQNPPITFIDKIKALKVNGFDSNVASIKYTVLVYIALADTQSVSLDDDSLDITLFKTIFMNTFQREYTHGKTLISDCADSFKEQYLITKNPMEYQFCHTGIKRAVLITYGLVALSHLIEKACLSELLTIIRPCSYKQHKNETIVPISESRGYADFSSRILHEFQKTENNSKNIGIYLKKYAITSKDFKFLETVLKSFMKFTESVKGYKYTPFMIKVFYEMTDESKYILPYDLKPTNFRLKWEIITAAYFSIENTFNLLVENMMKNNDRESIMYSVIDDLGNTLFHYFVIWGYHSGLCFCEDEHINKVCITNFAGYTTLCFAAYLGRSNYFRVLLQRIKVDYSFFAILRKTFTGTITDSEMHFMHLEYLIKTGKTSAGKTVTSTETWINVDAQIVPKITFGEQDEYDESMNILNNKYKTVKKSINNKEIEKAVDALDGNYKEGIIVNQSDMLDDCNAQDQTVIHVERGFPSDDVGETVTKHGISHQNKDFCNEVNDLTDVKTDLQLDNFQLRDAQNF